MLKKRLQEGREHWVEELPGVLWPLRTMRRCPTRETHFCLAYGMEAIIPTKVGMPIL